MIRPETELDSEARLKTTEEADFDERYYMASQWQLMWRKFKKHKLAAVGLVVLIILYTLGIFAEFFAPHDLSKRNIKRIYAPPTSFHFLDTEGNFSLIPFVYGLKMKTDPETWKKVYTFDTNQKYYLRLFVRGDEYKLLGIFTGNIHFIGLEGKGELYLLGTDYSGRDLASRVIHALRVSLFIGLVAVFLTFILGCLMGGLSGFYGGWIDLLIQRIIEFLLSIPSIPLWMGLAAAVPKTWDSLQTYFMITIILSTMGWCALARVIRGKFLEIREQDFVTAAIVAGAKDSYVIKKHLLPSFISYLIVAVTLEIPGIILGETALSFLGIGLRPPIVSLGVLLKDAQNISAIALTPWILTPGLAVVLIVLAFNFVGDGLRDAADPYK